MSKKVISVDFVIPCDKVSTYSYLSEQSLLDADIIIFNPFNPTLSNYYYLLGDRHDGKPCFTENSSSKFTEVTNHWKHELQTALNSGKTAFVLFKKYEEFFVHTGQKDFSGTGRNTRTTNYVTKTNNYAFFPVELGTIVNKGGAEMKLLGSNILAPLWSKFGSYMRYESYIDSKLTEATFLTKTGEKTVGAIFKVGAGNLILLPPINYDVEAFSEKLGKKPNWNQEGLSFGLSLLQLVLEIDNSLRGSVERTLPPEWIKSKQFELAQANETHALILNTQKEIDKLENYKKELEVALIEKQSLRDLLFEQGKPLEQAVIRALKTLGYHAENYNDGTLELDQVIISPEGNRYIGECEGKNDKDIDISKFRQLSESLSADFSREEITEKAFGILFGNPQRLIEPSKRSLDFTAKCKVGAGREKIALVKTSDLFVVARYLQENDNPAFQQACREAIHSGLGKVVVFPEPNESPISVAVV